MGIKYCSTLKEDAQKVFDDNFKDVDPNATLTQDADGNWVIEASAQKTTILVPSLLVDDKDGKQIPVTEEEHKEWLKDPSKFNKVKQ